MTLANWLHRRPQTVVAIDLNMISITTDKQVNHVNNKRSTIWIQMNGSDAVRSRIASVGQGIGQLSGSEYSKPSPTGGIDHAAIATNTANNPGGC